MLGRFWSGRSHWGKTDIGLTADLAFQEVATAIGHHNC